MEYATDNHNTIAAQGSAHETEKGVYSDKLSEALREVLDDPFEIQRIMENAGGNYYILLSNACVSKITNSDIPDDTSHFDNADELIDHITSDARIVAEDRIAAREPE